MAPVESYDSPAEEPLTGYCPHTLETGHPLTLVSSETFEENLDKKTMGKEACTIGTNPCLEEKSTKEA